jgi:hypothetical protein
LFLHKGHNVFLFTDGQVEKEIKKRGNTEVYRTKQEICLSLLPTPNLIPFPKSGPWQQRTKSSSYFKSNSDCTTLLYIQSIQASLSSISTRTPKKKKKQQLGMVVYAYNPSYPGSRDHEGSSWNPAQANTFFFFGR